MQFDKDVKSEHVTLFQEARSLLLSFEGMEETKKERITTYSKDRKGICHMRTMPHGIDFGFLKGAKMEDKFNLLTGNGKVMRVLPQEILNKEIVTYYLTQAIAINANK